jgi:hypothetical protein
MEIILVHWLVKTGREKDFEEHWRSSMSVEKAQGFYREIRTRQVTKPDSKFNTFSITDPNYSTYINIGFWESIEYFEKAIQKVFPRATEKKDASGKTKQTVELEAFEFKIRERIVLQRIADRGGQLPDDASLFHEINETS